MTNDHPADLMPEANLADTLDLGRDRLREYRKTALQEGVHWQKKARRIFYTSEGVEAVTTALGGGVEHQGITVDSVIQEHQSKIEKMAAAPVAVFNRKYPNPSLVEGLLDGNPVKVRIRPGSCDKCRRGIHALKVEKTDVAGLYVLLSIETIPANQRGA